VDLEIPLGIERTDRLVVTADMSPPHLAPSIVLSTPRMIEAMEWAATNSVQPYLGEGRTSVGTHVDVSHEAAAREGDQLTVHSKLIGRDRRRLTFEVSVMVGHKIIGRGTHERFVVQR
jgi:predicted thioesterase